MTTIENYVRLLDGRWIFRKNLKSANILDAILLFIQRIVLFQSQSVATSLWIVRAHNFEKGNNG